MKKESVKLSFLFLVAILVVSLSFGFVLAEDEVGDTDVNGDTDINQEDMDDLEDALYDMTDVGDDSDFDEEDTDDLDNYLDNEFEDEFDDKEEKDMDESVEDEEESSVDLDDVEEEYADEELGDVGTSAPGYIEWLLKNFRDELENKERKIGDIRKHIQNGDFERARMALEEYRHYAEMLEDEIDPDKREEARKSAVRIRKVLREIEKELSEDQKEDFYEDIIDRETGILTSAEIASKIHELCEQLAALDPNEYSRICKIDDDAPDWQKKKHKKWTAEQRKEAEEFGSIMKSCFRTSGRDCRCEDITFYDFSVACEKASSLAVECDEGDEDSCRALDELEMPELPEHLQDVFDEIEAKEAQYENHMPYECVSAGATTPKECSKIMIETGAPEECKQALLDSGCERERDCRKICDEIMFDLHAPQECIDKDITDPEECGRFMDSFRDDFGGRGPGPGGPGFGRDCMSISDPMERLKCFEGKLTESGDQYGPRGGEGDGEITWQCKEHRIHWPPDCEKFMKDELPKILAMEKEDRDQRFEDIKKRERECADKCERENAAWDFAGGNCRCFNHGGGGDDRGGDRRGGDGGGGAKCDDCQSQCPDKPGQRLRGTGCGSNGCECYYEDDNDNNNQGGGGDGGDNQNNQGGDKNNQGGGDTGGGDGGGQGGTGGTNTGGGDGTGGGGGDGGGTGGTDTGGGDTGGDTGGDNTAGVTGNAFLEYYFD